MDYSLCIGCIFVVCDCNPNYDIGSLVYMHMPMPVTTTTTISTKKCHQALKEWTMLYRIVDGLFIFNEGWLYVKAIAHRSKESLDAGYNQGKLPCTVSSGFQGSYHLQSSENFLPRMRSTFLIYVRSLSYLSDVSSS